AIGLFAPDGSSIAWSGEHRGGVPLEARLGEQPYLFHEGPLFSYLYLVRPLEGGMTAAAAFLLEGEIDVGEGVVPFAERFERRYATRPRFWDPERASAESVWDWATDEGPILSVSFIELTQQAWWERVVHLGRRGAAVAGLLSLILLSVGWYRSRMEGSGVPVLVGTAALLVAPLGDLTAADVLFSPLQFVLPGPLDVTLGVLLVLLVGGAVWLLTRSEPAAGRAIPLRVWVPIVALIFPVGLVLTSRSAADGLLAARAAGGFSVQLAAALLIGLPLFIIARRAEVPPLSARNPRLARFGGCVLPPLLGNAVLHVSCPV